jgi:rare lipoprotein A
VKRWLVGACVAGIAGCGTAPRQESRVERAERAERPPPVARAPAARAPAQAPAATPTLRAPRGGGYYLDDGPGDSPPPDLENIPEPVPQLEPLHRAAMRPYVVLGQSFTPMTELQPYKARGIASWYGRRYHGKQTSNGEIYDMYGISAAHPTLPLPSYARVTHLGSGRSIVVRVNDRGPFLEGRLIDLSYTAAYRLGVLGGGSAMVEVESLIPDGSSAGTYVAAPRPRVASVAPAPRVAPPPPSNIADADPIAAIAAAARDPETAASAAPSAADGIYLQLGAFGSRENAQGYLERARVQFDWLAERLQVRVREGLFRVHAGPYASPGEARVAAERIAAALGTKPVFVTR